MSERKVPTARPTKTSCVFWVCVWLVAVYAALAVVFANWHRFQSNPTVIAVDRNYMEFNTTFPAMTICLDGLLNETRADKYINQKWGAVSGENKTFYRDFLQTVANVSYENLGNFQRFVDDSTIPRDGYYQIIQEISLDFPGTLEGFQPKLELDMTDRGNCYTVNSALRSNHHDRRKVKKSDAVPEIRETVKMNHETGPVWGLMSEVMTKATLCPHSPMEISDVTDLCETSLPNLIYDASYTVLELVAAPGVATLDIDQRKCRLPMESTLAVSRVYSYSHCRLECRMQRALSLCGCSPYFYPLIEGFRECTIEGLLCISKYKNIIKFLVDPDGDMAIKSCKCMTTCGFVSYKLGKKSEAAWQSGTQFTWAISRPPRIQLRRNVIYGPTDLLVSFGGTVGLFLGCSLLSGAEVIYFFTLRLFWQLTRLRKINLEH